MTARDVLAIDFGTANSYFCKCSGEAASPVGVDFGEGRDGIATAILCRESKSPLIGNTALDEFGEATDKERRAYRLCAQFKPELASSKDAQDAAIGFLQTVLEDARSQRLDLEPAEREVIFGIPSEADEEYRRTLTKVAQESGYGNIRMVDEPRGALLYHVLHRDIRPQHAMGGILVVDFGGGTCDFAFMRGVRVAHFWGEFYLGGRLFDDVFFQWFIDQNPDLLRQIRESGDEYLVHVRYCREAKEFFSRTMTRDRTETVSRIMGQFGRLKNMTWDEFCNRASNFYPSETFLNYLASIGSKKQHPLGSDKPIDLVNWFRESLRNGLDSNSISRDDIDFVILAGGSSLWPFVADVIELETNLSEDRIMRSDRPYAAIAEGLSIIPAKQLEIEAIKSELDSMLEAFAEESLRPLVSKRIYETVTSITDDIVSELFDKQIRPILLEFRLNGGTIRNLESKIQNAARGFERQIQSCVEDKMSIFSQGLAEDVNEVVNGWFTDHGLVLPDQSISMKRFDSKGISVIDPYAPDLYGEIFDTVAGVTSGIVAVIIAAICGGSGMALIASGPIGWLIGLVLGAVVAYLALQYGADQAKEMSKDWEVPGWMIKPVLTDTKIKKSRSLFRQDVFNEISKALTVPIDDIAEQIQKRTKLEIDALSELHRM